MEEKKKLLKLSLNEIKVDDDPTIVKAQFVLFDFDESHNKSIISKEVALEAKETVLNKPVVAKYNPVEEPGTATDAMGSHEVKLTTDRDGDLAIEYGTEAIGVFTTEGYITSVNTPEGEKEVFAADAVLWYSRYTDAIDLLFEWHSRNVNINTSVELLYQNYNVVEGIEYIQSPIYIDGHAILNSEQRGDHEVVLPGYDSSKLLSLEDKNEFNKLVAQAASRNTSEKEVKEDDEQVKKNVSDLRKVFELSHDDVRTKLYHALEQADYQWAWIVEVYEDYFIFEHEKCDDEEGKCEYKYVKASYTKGEDDTVTVSFEDATEVTFETQWKELDSVKEIEEEKETLTQQLSNAENEKADVEKSLNAANDELKALKEKVESLNEEINTLGEYKEKFEQAEFEAALEKEKEYYANKFNSLDKADEFEKEEVQELVSNSAKGDVEAKLQLNSMIVDFLEVKKEEPKRKEFQMTEEGQDKKSKSVDKESFEDKYLN